VSEEAVIALAFAALGWLAGAGHSFASFAPTTTSARELTGCAVTCLLLWWILAPAMVAARLYYGRR
jgi:hypothetical protein